MYEQLAMLAAEASGSIAAALQGLAIPAVAFGLLAVAVKRRAAVAALRCVAAEARINLLLHVFDAAVMLPVIAFLLSLLEQVLKVSGLARDGAELWSAVGQPLTLLAAVFAGDFVGYWRHRLEHTACLWPAHAVHHSDTAMGWLTLFRFHPINRVTTSLLDEAFLLLLGFPVWALVAANLLRHWYGMLIHADLPWTYGRLAGVFVSPAMHRWHHARDPQACGTNFATVFSLFDRAFGTYRVPGLCHAPPGVEEDIGRGALAQLLYPFRAWARSLGARMPARGARQARAASP